jgi:hypothetical protein
MVTVRFLDVNDGLGTYNTANFYGGATVEVGLTVLGAITCSDGANISGEIRAVGAAVKADTFVGIKNSGATLAAAGEARLFVDSDGDLKVIFGNGVTKTLATDS